MPCGGSHIVQLSSMDLGLWVCVAKELNTAANVIP